MKHCLLPLLAAALVLPALACQMVQDYPELTGEHPVGTTLLDLTDATRGDHFTPDPDDHRRLAVRAYYPAATTEGYEPIPYVDEALGKALQEQMGMPSMGGEAASRAFAEAPVAAGGPFPVIIFSHGYSSFPGQNATQMEELASRGYVVLSLSHPGESALTQYPDGTTVGIAETPYMMLLEETYKGGMSAYGEAYVPLVDPVREAATAGEQRAAMVTLSRSLFYLGLERSVTVWAEDSRFVIAELPALHAGHPVLAGALDVDRVGIYGHSFGGIAAGEVCMTPDSGVVAGINLDAPQLMYVDDPGRALQTPFLFVYGDSTKAGKHVIDTSGINGFLAEGSSHDAYELTLSGAGHYNFSDMGYIPMLRYLGMLGPIDGAHAAEITGAYVTAFFDHYLKGEDAPLLAAAPEAYPEATLEVY